MLDFRRHSRVRRRSQHPLERRMVGLVGVSAVVVLLMVAAGNPRNWRWLVPDDPAAVQQGAQRVQPAPDEPIVVATGEEKPPAAQPPDNAPPVDAPDAETPQPAAGREKLFPGVRRDYLDNVRDDTVFRAAESDGWFHLFALLARTDNQRLVKASEGPASYLQLDEQPAEYRGRLVTIHGVVRAAKRVKAEANAFNVREYYQLWIQPDRNASTLLALYCLELPDGFPLGSSLDEDCTATGFFYKRWAYESRGGVTTAPLLAAKTIEWQPRPVAAEKPAVPLVDELVKAAAVALLLAVVALAFVVWRGRCSQSRRHVERSDVGAAMAALDNKGHSETSNQ